MSDATSINPITGLPLDDKKDKKKEDKIINPITGNEITPSEEPDTRLDILGTSATDVRSFDLGKEDLSDFQEYGVEILRGEDHYENRAQSQGTANKIGSGLVRLPLTAATKLASSLGFTGSLLLNSFDPDNWGEGTQGAIVNAAADNSISKMFTDLEDHIKEQIAPIYETNAYKNGDWLSQMGTVEFWASDLVDGLAFGLSSLAETAMLTGPLKAASGIAASRTAQLAKAAKLTDKVMDIKKLSNAYGRLGSTALISTGEAMFEAKDVRDQLIAKGVDPEIAAEKARDAFALNMLVLGPSNWIETSYLMKTLGRKPANAMSNRIGFKPGYLAYDKTPELLGFAKYMDSTPARMLKAYGVNTFSEGFYEENAQLAIQNLMQEYGEGKKTGNILNALMDMPGAMADNLKTDEGKKSIVLGALVGGIMSTYGSLRERGAEQALRDKYIESLNQANQAWFDTESVWKKEITKVPVTDETNAVVYEEGTPEATENYGEITFDDGQTKVYKTKDEFENDKVNGRTETHVLTDSDHNPVLDEAKWAGLIANKELATDMDYIIDALYQNGEYEKYKIYRGAKFNERVKAYHNAGIFDTLLEQYEQARNYTPEELQSLGIDINEKDINGNPRSTDEIIDEYIEDAKELKKLFDVVEKQVVPTTFGKIKYGKEEIKLDADAVANRQRQQLYDIAAREYFVGKELKRVKQNIADILAEGEESPLISELREIEAKITKNAESLLDAEVKDKKEEKERYEEEAKKLNKELEEFKADYQEQIDKIEKDATGTEKLLSAIAKQKLNAEEIKAAELDLVKRDLNDQFEKISHPTKGKNYFLDNWFRVTSSKTAGQVTKLSNSKLLTTGPVAYFMYENSKLKSIRLKSQIEDTVRNNFSDALLERLVSGEKLIDILNDILTVKPVLTQRAFDILKRHVGHNMIALQQKQDDMYKPLDEEQFALEALQKNYKGTEWYDKHEERWQELEDQKDDLDQTPDYIELEEQKKALDTALKDIEKLKLVGKTIESTSDNKLRHRIAEEFYGPLMTEIEQNVNLNEDYDDLDEVDNATRVLNHMIKLYDHKQKDNPYREIIQNTIKKSLEELNNIRKEITKRQENRAAQQEEIWDNYTTARWQSLGIVLNNPVPDLATEHKEHPSFVNVIAAIKSLVPQYDDIMEQAAADFYEPIYADALYQAIKERAKVDKVGYETVIAALQEVKNVFAQTVLDVPTMTSKLRIVNEKHTTERAVANHSLHLSIYKDKPKRAFKALIASLRDEKYDDGNKKSSLYKFLKDADVEKFHRNVLKEIEDGVEGRERFEEFVRFHKIYGAIEEALETLASPSYDIEVQLGLENEALKADNTTPAPTSQQVIAIRELSRYTRKPVLDKIYSGWAYLRGYAGTGKTKVTLYWASKFLGITEPKSQIFAIGHTDSSTKTVTESIGSNPTSSFEKLLAGEIGEKTKLIVIDEVGAFTNDDLRAVGEKVQELNKTRENKIRVITLGDPSQMTFDKGTMNAPIDDALYLINSEEIVNIQPLTIRYRSNVGAVVNFQDKFLDQTQDLLRQEPIVVRSNTKDIAREANHFQPLGVQGTKTFTPESIVSVLSARKGSNTSKALIVNDKNLDQYKQALQKAGVTDVEVVSVYEAQGRTYEEVYVNLKYDNDYTSVEHYNKGMYTATSRASKFIYVGHVPTNTELDTDIISSSDRQNTEIKERRAKYTEELEQDIQSIKDLRQFTPQNEEAEIVVIEEEKKNEAKSEETKKNENITVEEGNEYIAGEFGEYTVVKDPKNPEEYIIKDGRGKEISKGLSEEEALMQAEEMAEKDEEENAKPKEEDVEEGLGPAITSDFDETEEEAQTYEAIPSSVDVSDTKTFDPYFEEPLAETEPYVLSEEEFNHKLEYPTNKSLQPIKDKEGNLLDDPLKVGDTVQYAWGYPTEDENASPVIYVLKQIEGMETTYREVGRLGAKDIEKLPDVYQGRIQKALEDNEVVTFDEGTEKNGIITTDYGIFTLFEGRITTPPKKLRYEYENKPTVLTKDKIEQHIAHFKNKFLGKENIYNPRPGDIKIRVFRGNEVDAINEAWPGLHLVAGVPYLYFRNPRKDNSNKEHVRPQFIRYNPRVMNSKVHSEMLTDILAYIELGEKLNDLIAVKGFRMGNKYFDTMIRELGKGKVEAAKATVTRVKLSGKNTAIQQFDPTILDDIGVQKLARDVYKLLYTEDNDRAPEAWTKKDSVQYKDETNAFTNKDGKPITRKIKDIITTDEGVLVTVYGVKKGKEYVKIPASDLKLVNDATPGPAQQAHNRIAKANLMADGTLIREIRHIKGKKPFTTGRLLAPIRDTFFKLENEVHTSYIDRVMRKTGKDYTTVVEEIMNSEDKFRLTANLSIEKLKKIYAFDGKGNSVTKLRVPIPIVSSEMNLSDKDYPGAKEPIPSRTAPLNVKTYKKYFETTFSDIKQTEINVTLGGKNEPEDTTPRDEEGNELEDPNTFDEEGFELDKVREDGVGPGKLISENKARKILKKLLPNATDDQLRIVDVARMMQIRKGKAVWATYRKGIITMAEDGVTEAVLRHEIVHEVIDRYLTPKEKAELFTAAKLEYGNKSPRALEEEIADEFMYWNSFTNRLRRLFRKILEFFNFIAANNSVIEQFFADLDAGRFTEINNTDIDFGYKDKLSIEEQFGDVDNYIEAKKWFKNKLFQATSTVAYRKDASKSSKKLIKYSAVPKRIDPRQLDLTLPKTKAEVFRFIYKQLVDELKEARTTAPSLRAELERTRADKANYTTTGKPTKDFLRKEEKVRNAELRLEALSKLTVLQNFTDVVTDFYPSIRLRKGQQVIKLDRVVESIITEQVPADMTAEEKAALRDAQTESGSLYQNHIQDSDLRDPKKSLTQRAKDFTSFIMYPTSSKDPVTGTISETYQSIPYKQAYAILLEKMQGIDFSDTKLAARQLDRAFGNNPSVKDRAILEHLRRLIKNADASRYIPDAESVRIINEEKKGIGRDKIKVKEKNFLVARRGFFLNEDTFVSEGVEYNRRNQTTKQFFQEIYENTPYKDYNAIAGLYNKYQASITLAELTTATVGMIKKNVKLGMRVAVTVDKETGTRGFENRYITQNEYGYRENIRAKIIKEVEKQFMNNYGNFNSRLKSIDKLQDASKKIANTKELLIDLQLLNERAILPYAEANSTIEDLLGMARDWNTSKKDMSGVVSNSSERISRITSLIVDNTDLKTVTSYTRGDGKNAWTHMEGNQALESIKSLMNTWRTKPAFMNTSFFSLNPFIKEGMRDKSQETVEGITQKLYNYVHHDSIKEEGSIYAKLYGQESRVDWISRVFLFQFVGFLEGSARSKALKYVQPFWTNSDKPNNEGVEIDVLTDAKVKEHIKLAIQQEAYKTPKENVKNYNANIEFSSLAGLSRRATIAETTDSYKIEQMANAVIEELNKETERVLDILTSNNFRISSSQINTLYRDFPNLFNSEFKDIIEKQVDNSLDFSKVEDLPNYREQIKPIVDLWVKNHYINSHFLNQITQGDPSSFKSKVDENGNPRRVNEFDIIKRISIAFAQGKRGLVHEEHGMKEHYNIAVGKDIKAYIKGKDYEKFLYLLNRAGYDKHDGQGFMLPERHADVVKGFGPAAGMAIVKKPVHYEIDPMGLSRALKYSSIVLTDELVSMFPGLYDLREEMKGREGREQVDEFIFGSGVKVGAPLVEAQYNGNELFTNITNDNIVRLSNRYWRIQQQPYHDAKHQKASHPTQITYFADSNGENFEQAMELYTAIGDAYNAGLDSADLEYSFTHESVRTARVLRNELIRAKEKDENRDKGRFLEFLAAKDENGNPITSLNAPFLIKEVVIQMANILSKKTVELKYPGGKFVLQAAYGTGYLRDDQVLESTAYQVLKENNFIEPKWRDEEGYAEVYLPDTYQASIGEGDFVLPEDYSEDAEGLYHKLLGFRIPSTELHSAVPLKVIGFYPTTPGMNENIIIAPHEIVFFHGSDYDVDSLFVMKRGEANMSIASVDGSKVFIEEGKFAGYKGGKANFEESLFIVDERIDQLRFKRKQLIQDFIDQQPEQGPENEEQERARGQFYHDMAESTIALKAHYELKQTILKNKVLESLLEIITAKRNQDTMMRPISLARMSGTSLKGAEESLFDMLVRLLPDIKSHDDLYADRDLNMPLDQASMHMDNHSGAALTGVFADTAKSFFYAMFGARAVENKEKVNAKLNSKLHININGGVYDGLSLKELKVENGKLVENKVITTLDENNQPVKEVPSTSETIDMLINAAIDNVKEQILAIINITAETKGVMAGLSSVGIPLHTVAKILRQPTLLKASLDKKNVKIQMDNIKAKLGTITEEELEEMLPEVTDTLLEKYLSSYEKAEQAIEEMDQEGLLFQYAVLKEAAKANKIANEFAELSSFLHTIQQMPIYFWEMQDKLELLDKFYAKRKKGDYARHKEGVDKGKRILNEDFAFTNVDILEIPHIKAAFKILKTLKARTQDTILAHSQPLVDFSMDIKKMTKLELIEKRGFYDAYANKEAEIYRDEFIKYILNGLNFTAGYGEKAVSVNIDNSAQEPYTFEYAGIEYNLETDEAWIENFIDSIEKADKKYPDNKFLGGLIIKRGHPRKTRYIDFINLGTLEEEDIYKFQKDFIALKNDDGSYSDLQVGFLKYAVLTQGLAFGSRNYSQVMPPAIYAGLFRSLDSKLRYFFRKRRGEKKEAAEKRATDYLDNIKSHFAIQTMINNLDKMPAMRENDLGKGNIDNKFFYDASFENVEGKTFDRYIKLYDKLYRHIKTTPSKTVKDKDGKETTEKGMVYYAEVGSTKRGTFYNYSRVAEKVGYDVIKAFDPSVVVKRFSNLETLSRSVYRVDPKTQVGSFETIEGIDNKGNIQLFEETTSQKLLQGTVIRAIAKTDLLRANYIDYRVAEVVEGKDDKTFYRLERIYENPETERALEETDQVMKISKDQEDDIKRCKQQGVD
jgi:hypothetical protein